MTESTTTQKTICTGSPISFTLLVLCLPFLVYLFLKPLLNCLENCCCPRSSEDAEPLVMHANPAFGLDLEAIASARARARARRRSTIDKMLMRARHLRKKKNVGDADPAAAPAPLRTAAPVTTEQPTRRRSAVAALARDAETGGRRASPPCMMETTGRSPWPTSSSACCFCRCRSSAEPAEGRTRAEEESKEDIAGWTPPPPPSRVTIEIPNTVAHAVLKLRRAVRLGHGASSSSRARRSLGDRHARALRTDRTDSRPRRSPGARPLAFTCSAAPPRPRALQGAHLACIACVRA